ncbi:MAG: hypothetical protein FWG71_09530 [Synergistaceae bacterium]|nr:hypothetical protein [Synergistaceae bacterium]
MTVAQNAVKESLCRRIFDLPDEKIGMVERYVSDLEEYKGKILMPNDFNEPANLPNSITLASEKALAKDWLLPEEDEAWANI